MCCRSSFLQQAARLQSEVDDDEVRKDDGESM